ncbi:MAG: fibronectin type III domain-containing protein [Bacteroidetes bacterium]|nr:fibronectin type III domain-containing protein [Bacteroidota bacterium]
MLSSVWMGASAQVSTYYVFSQANGTYTPITGTSLLGSSFDDNTSSLVTIPSFNFNGSVCKRMFVCSNGWLALRTSNSVTSTSTTPLQSTMTATGVIAPMGVDLVNAASGSPSVSWAVVGTEVVVQWQNVARYIFGGSSESFSFQARMDTVTGTIKFVYDAVSGATTSTLMPGIGLRGASNSDFNDRSLASGAWTSTALGSANSSTVFMDNTTSSVPTSGLTFIYSVPSCFPPSGVTASNITINSADLSWTAPTNGVPVGYGWEVVAHGAGAFSTPIAYNYVVGATTTNTGTVLTPNTQYDVYVKSGCSLTNLSDTSIWSTLGTFTTLATCITPSALTASGVTATGATISWTASPSAPANGYVYKAVAAGAGSGGTAVESGAVAAGVTTATFSSLSPSTSYDLYVRAACSGTDSSSWIGPASIMTTCVAVTALPYTESFESATLAADCWSASAGAGYSYLFEPVAADATYGAAGPETGLQFARLNVFNAQTAYNPYIMTSPSIVLPAAMQQVSYYYFLGANGNTTNPLRLLISTNNGTTWDTIYTHTTANSSFASTNAVSNWHKNTIYLPAYTNTTAIFRFVAISNYGSGECNMGVDQFTISAAPTCFPPTGVTTTGVTATSATLSWTAPALGSPAGYAWEVVATGAGSGATPVASNVVTAPTTTASTGSVLTPSTTYDVYVKTGCSLTNLSDTSTWSLVYTFSTPAACAAPTALTAGVVTSSSAAFSWTASVTNPSNGYVYEVVASGAGSAGTPVTTGAVGAGVTTATVSGLSAQTSYDIYVRSNCGADSSAWAGPLSIATPCNAITTLPWTEGFETLPATAGTNVYPACWSYTNITTTYTNPNYTCSATCNSNTARTGTNFMGGSWYFNVWEYTPGFQLTAGTNYDYSFWYRTTDATNGYVVSSAYGTAPNAGAMTTILGTITNAVSSGSYTKVTYTFQVPTTGVYYLGHHDSCPTYSPNGIAFDDFSLQLSPNCVAAGTPTLTSVNSGGGSISWTASLSSPANGYIWAVVPSGSGPSATPVATGTTAAGVTTATITGLNSNTAYVAYVRAVCSSTDSSAWTDSLRLVTTCVNSSLPLIEGFNSTTIPACWSQQYLTGTSPMLYVATMGNPTTAPQEGSDFVQWTSYIYPNTAGNETRLISKPITTSGVPSVDISFYWLHDATNYTTGAYLNEGMTVQYSTDLVNWTDVQFFPRVDLTLQPTGSAWFQKLLTLPAAVANQPTVYIGFKFHSEYGNNCAFDNLHIYATPACSGAPSALAIGGVSSTTASVNWADASPVPAVGYHWIITPAGAGPGAGIDSGDVTVDTANITGLTPNTMYDFYVQSNCGGGSGLGSLAGPITVQTTCVNATLPLIEGFNSTSIPSCWSQQYVVGNDDLQYLASSFNPTTTPQEGTDYVYWNGYGITGGNETRLVSPGITTTGIPSVDISFYFYNEHSNYYNSGNYLNEGVTVQYSTDLVNWTDVQFFPREDASFALGTGAWRQKYLTLPAGAGNQATIYVGFKFHSEFGDNVSFDNLHIFQSSPCAGGPTAINVAPQSTTTVVVSWAAGSPAPSNGYNVVVVAAGDSVNGTVLATGSTAAGVTTDTITGLTANTAYDVYVRSNCDTVGVGYWVGPTGFSTPCNAITSIPWLENFEGMTTVGQDIVPSCWLPTPSGRWESEDAPFIFPTLDARSGTHYLTDRYNADDTIYTPSFALTGGTQYEFYFYYRTDGYTGWDSLYALMGTSQSPSGMTQVIGTPVAGPTNTQYMKYSAIFTPATSGDYFFGVKLLASFSPDDIAFDDFGLQEVVPCPNPPLAGVISGPSSVCSGNLASLSLTGYSPYTQLQWQGSLDSINWQDLTGATNDFYQDYPTSVTYYRVKVNCADSAYSPVFTVNMNAPTLCYCTSGLGGFCGGNDIDTARILGTNFNVNYTICNTTSGGDAYTIFPAIGDSTATLQRGGAYTFYLHMTGTSISSIWIDTNQNGVFDTYEWIQPTVAATNGTAVFTIQGYTRLGTTGMRIRSRNQGNTNNASSACLNFGSGETFDFQITIVDTNCNHTPVVTPTATTPTCYGSSNGSLSIALSGGLAPFTHMWSTGDTTTSLSNLSAGVYTDTITFAGGCTYVYTDTLTQPAMLSAMDTVTPVLCYGGATGTVTVTVSGGTPTYTHTWSTGATGAQLTGVAAGSYTDTISDANGCALILHSDTVTQPAAAVSIVLDSAKAAKCNGQSNGAIYTTASGGTGAYTYAWTGTSQTTDDVTGLAAGGYVVVVTDANHCTATLTDTVTQPAAVTIVTDSVVNAKCNTSSDGSIYVHVTGGTVPYTYLWTPGNTATSSLFFKPAGTYTLSVTDHNGCTATASNTITAPSAISLTTNITNQVQNGTMGAISVTASGGTQPYAYHWTPGGGTTATISNLTSDLYTVTVTDANGCTATRSDSVRLILGLKDVNGDITDIYVYPNPSSAVFNVTVKLSHSMPVDLDVYTATGQKIDVATKENNATGTFVLDMTNEASGVYIVKVKAGDQVVTQRVTLVK